MAFTFDNHTIIKSHRKILAPIIHSLWCPETLALVIQCIIATSKAIPTSPKFTDENWSPPSNCLPTTIIKLSTVITSSIGDLFGMTNMKDRHLPCDLPKQQEKWTIAEDVKGPEQILLFPIDLVVVVSHLRFSCSKSHCSLLMIQKTMLSLLKAHKIIPEIISR